MENTSDDQFVRIEHPKIGDRTILFMSLAFALGFLICIAVGASGPPIFTTVPASLERLQTLSSNNTTWKGHLGNIKQFQRYLYVTATIERPGFVGPSSFLPPSVDFSYTQDVYITVAAKNGDGSFTTVENANLKHVTITCEANQQWCNTIPVFFDALVECSDLYITAEFVVPAANGQTFGGVNDLTVHVSYESPKYTTFMLGWTYFFLGATIIVMFFPCYGYFWVMSQIKRKKWSSQQVWIAVLLCSLFFYDDPLFAVELQPGNDLAVLYVFFMATFLVIILLYWLVILDELRIDGDSNSGRSKLNALFFLKLLLCFAIWVILLGTYISVKRKEMIDPSYDVTSNQSRPYYGALAAFMAIYILWVFFVIIKCFHHVGKMIPGYRFLFFITLSTIIVTIIGIFLVAFYPLRGAPIGLLCIFGLYNLYVWVLAIAYTPNYSFGGRTNLEIDELKLYFPSQRSTNGKQSEHQLILKEEIVTADLDFENIEVEL